MLAKPFIGKSFCALSHESDLYAVCESDKERKTPNDDMAFLKIGLWNHIVACRAQRNLVLSENNNSEPGDDQDFVCNTLELYGDDVYNQI